MKNMYRYTDGGLKNVWLANGYEIRKSRYGKGVSIKNLDGLCVAICLALAKKPSPLTGTEFRYIRSAGLLQSQAGLAKLLGNNEQAVALWERPATCRAGPTSWYDSFTWPRRKAMRRLPPPLRGSMSSSGPRSRRSCSEPQTQDGPRRSSRKAKTKTSRHRKRATPSDSPAPYRDNTHVVNVFRSASSNCGNPGIGTCPHLPLPPLRMLCITLAAASLLPAYFAATSWKAGPTTFLSTAWQAVHWLAPSSASALRGAVEAAGAAALRRPLRVLHCRAPRHRS